MGFNEEFKKYKKKILKLKVEDMTEEATKNSIIMPFFILLGYDVFNPDEFVPEYTCDVATKKGEKVDYAILHDGDPVMLIEVKRAGMKLQKQQQGQLYRYFSTNRCRIAVLTNGFNYLFFSDINAPNVMDDEPFFAFNISEDDESIYLPSLEQFCKENFNIKTILSKAVFLKYEKVVVKTMMQDLVEPSDEFVKYFLSRPEIKTGSRITSQMIDKFRESTVKALRSVMEIEVIDGSVSLDNISVPEQGETTIPPECESIITMIKEMSSDNSVDYSKDGKVHTIMIYCRGIKTGRLRLTYTKTGKSRFDYTDYKDNNKMKLFDDIENIRSLK